MKDLQPRMMPQDVPLWPLYVYHSDASDTVYVQIEGAVLEVQVSDLMNPGDVSLHLGARLLSTGDGWGLTGTTLELPCRKKLSSIAQWVLIELPEGGHVVWDWEQVHELVRRRFVYLEAQDEVLPPASERPLP